MFQNFRYIILPLLFLCLTVSQQIHLRDEFFEATCTTHRIIACSAKGDSFKFAIITNNQRGTVKNLRKQYGGNDGD